MVLWRVHVELEDRPGRLGELATAIGTAGCNIISLHVVGEPADDGSVTDELLVKVPEGIEAGTLVDAVRQAGIPCTLLVRADATELSDPATTALALARMVAADPGSAPRAVATMLRARLVDPAAQSANGSAGGHPYVTRVGAQQLQIGRAWPFTATELSRAAALLELAGQLELRGNHRPSADDRVMVLRDGSEVRLRHVGPGDAPLVAALHARCSPEVRRARFLAPASQLPDAELAMLLGSPRGHALLAVTTDGGSAVGLANLEPADTPGSARICALVENAWQGRGLGTALLRRLIEIGAAEGVTELVGIARPADVGVTRLLRRAGLRPSAELVGEEVHLKARHHAG
ncbi:GNAT family N-acetyltransferase [Actinomycetes bacterium KLBMP 9759]